MPRNSLFLLLLRKADQDDGCDGLDKPQVRDQISALRAWILEHVKKIN